MIKPTPTYKIEMNIESLEKFILGTMESVRRDELSVDKADVISKLADKAIKAQLVKVMNKSRMNDKSPIPFLESVSQQTFMIENSKHDTDKS